MRVVRDLFEGGKKLRKCGILYYMKICISTFENSCPYNAASHARTHTRYCKSHVLMKLRACITYYYHMVPSYTKASLSHGTKLYENIIITWYQATCIRKKSCFNEIEGLYNILSHGTKLYEKITCFNEIEGLYNILSHGTKLYESIIITWYQATCIRKKSRFNEIEGLYNIIIITWYQAIRKIVVFFVLTLLLVLLTRNNTDDNKLMIIL